MAAGWIHYRFDGTKHVLGLWDGATENSTVVTALFEDLIDRGLPRERDYLFVVDVSKALRKATSSVFGKNAAVQRSPQGEERRLAPPETSPSDDSQSLASGREVKSYADAKKALEQLAAKLDDLSPGAAANLRGRLGETLTIHRLEVHEELRPVLRSTNAIENIFARTRELCRIP